MEFMPAYIVATTNNNTQFENAMVVYTILHKRLRALFLRMLFLIEENKIVKIET